jgi:ComF family protein
MRFPVINDFLGLVFPKTCCLCRRSLFDFEQQICRVCLAKLPLTTHHLHPHENDLTVKIRGLSQTDCVISMLRFSKKGMSQKLLHQLKYKNKPEVGIELGKIYGSIIQTLAEERGWTQITSVPLHPIKQQRRGYNQSDQFAIGLSDALSLPIKEVLQRKAFTESQTNKSRIQRMDNVAEVFKLNIPVEGERILLVDDVMTTGATLIACADLLFKHHATQVDMAVIAAGKF